MLIDFTRHFPSIETAQNITTGETCLICHQVVPKGRDKYHYEGIGCKKCNWSLNFIISNKYGNPTEVTYCAYIMRFKEYEFAIGGDHLYIKKDSSNWYVWKPKQTMISLAQIMKAIGSGEVREFCKRAESEAQRALEARRRKEARELVI